MPKYLLGIDIGGTKIQGGVVNQKNQVIKYEKYPTEINKGKNVVVRNIINVIGKLFSKETKAIGIGITGLVDVKKGIAVQSPNLPKDWRNVPLKKIIEKKFKKPVTIDNDVNCFTLAEGLLGVGKKYNHVFGLTFGTGIGAGIMINKKIYHGGLGSTDFGHVILSEKRVKCSCGLYGHWESLVSGPAMINFYKNFTGKKLDAIAIQKRYYAGEKSAQKVVKLIAYYLGVGLANIINSLSPEIIIIGGGLSNFKVLLKLSLPTMHKLIIYPSLKKTKIIRASLGPETNILGAALITKGKYYF